MNMDAIAIVNDAVGGVTLTVTDDFSEVDPSITRGEITLTGEQAWRYVQTRKDVGNQLNLARMERQKQYVTALMEQLHSVEEDSGTFLVEVYEQIAPYIVTDCSVNVVTGLLQRCSDYELKEILSTEGRNIRGEEHYEFYVDENKLDDLILRLFYARKK
jgi:anionic cell wall polymer biosynthesis LytR-Cps2A-Psr (LCP) family protein